MTFCFKGVACRVTLIYPRTRKHKRAVVSAAEGTVRATWLP